LTGLFIVARLAISNERTTKAASLRHASKKAGLADDSHPDAFISNSIDDEFRTAAAFHSEKNNQPDRPGITRNAEKLSATCSISPVS